MYISLQDIYKKTFFILIKCNSIILKCFSMLYFFIYIKVILSYIIYARRLNYSARYLKCHHFRAKTFEKLLSFLLLIGATLCLWLCHCKLKKIDRMSFKQVFASMTVWLYGLMCQYRIRLK